MHHVREGDLVALVGVQDVEEVVRFVFELFFEVKVQYLTLIYIRDLDIHLAVQLDKLLVGDHAILVIVYLPEQVQELAQELFVLVELELFEDGKELRVEHLWIRHACDLHRLGSLS